MAEQPDFYLEHDDELCDDRDDDYEVGFDCGFIPGYGCQLAGTEDCDFDCPHRDALTNHPDYPNVTIAMCVPIWDADEPGILAAGALVDAGLSKQPQQDITDTSEPN